MITQQQIDETVSWEGFKSFGQFVLSHCEDGGLPDYEKMDLMQIPKLIPHIWVYDLRSEENVRNLLMGFAGEINCELHGGNISGTSYLEMSKKYGDTEDIVEHFHKSINDKSIAYGIGDTKTVPDKEAKYRNIESLFFPCSSDGVTVNWGIGCLDWKMTLSNHEKVFLYF